MSDSARAMAALASDIQQRYTTRRARYSERDARMRRVRDVMRGELNAEMRRLGAKTKEPAAPNLVRATVRTLAQRVGKMPRLHATSRLTSPTAKERAERHEDALYQRLVRQNFESMLPQAAYWLAPHGFVPFVLTMDGGLGQARIRLRDPLSCFPDTVWPHEPGVADCLFSYRMYPSEIAVAFPEARGYFPGDDGSQQQVTIAEWCDAEKTVVCIVEPEQHVLALIPNPVGACNVFIARDLTPDFDFYGQFDQVVPIMEAEARLMALVEAYAEQQVTAETVVIGEIISNEGDWAHGLGAINQLEPAPNASVTKLTNNMSPQVFQQLAMFERAQRLTGSIPAQLSGEPEVSFATGRGIEKLVAVVDDNVAHYQNILALCLKEVFARVPLFEAAHGLPNPGFAPDVTVHPQFNSGADPATTVRLLQLVGAKILSRQSASNQMPEVGNPVEEEGRVTAESIREAILATIMGEASNGMADKRQLIALAKAVENGTRLEDALDAYLAAVEEAAAEQAPTPEMLTEATGAAGGAPPSLQALLGLTPGGEAVGGIQGRVAV